MTTPNAASTETPASAASTETPNTTQTTGDNSLMGAEAKVEATKSGEQPKVETKPGEKPAVEVAKPIELKLPDGVKVPDEVIGAFKEFATKNKLSGEQAQAALDWQLSQNAAQQKSYEASAQKRAESWLAELKADKEIGGAKWESTLTDIKNGKQWLGEEFTTLMHQIGIGNHPALARAVARIGRLNREDSVKSTANKPADGVPVPFSQKAYPSMQKKEKDS